ncbi:MAG: glycoside hydrolase, partial [Gemmatimonadaceae bacterium]
WFPAVNGSAAGGSGRAQDPRPMQRIGGGDLPTIVVDGKNEDVVYSCSTVFWRTEDGGVTWTAVRGAPGGDDYQRAWVNPSNPDVILMVADQGGVISANRGKSWSNWYTQPTAAMYHVTIDNGFPYLVCGGQQDSGSACVASRSMDGEITFHDWHPVNIQEYGVAAPDPKNPDLVYASQRTNVSLYDRRTAQTTTVGPSAEMRAGAFGRNVRTMPIEWSRVDNKTLFYAASAVFKSTDQAHTWTRISPDLARQTWEVPATAGKYAAAVTPGPQGSITALSASPRDLKIIWIGTDDGAIQVTMDGGAKWTNVTPGMVKPWARIFNIEAGHFDNLTAYAAANTMRIDDMNPHFLRTHDGGKSWTEINVGVAPGVVVNAIREDPKKKGLLYGATDTQVWVSFDDGDHWQSLKLDMPAISVRDIQIKDDSTCMCADLVAGTHGRGFWILDDVTPLRAAADIRAAESAHAAYLVKPQTAVRMRFATNDPTPWPPEVPAGENPAPGAPIDYYLSSASSSPVKLEILDAKGKTIRTYSSDAKLPAVDPAIDPVKYNQMCQQNPGLTDCALPLYWPAPIVGLSATGGMHRFAWDLQMDPISENGGGRGGGTGSNGAVPHRTYTSVNAPWAPPGNYTVRLTVDGTHYTQPIVLRLDPRVKTPAAALTQLSTLTREMYDGASTMHAASVQAHALSAQVAKASGTDAATFKAQLDTIAPPVTVGGGGRGGRGGGRGGAGAPAGPMTLDAATNAMVAAAMAMQGADAAPTANEIAGVANARAGAAAVMAKWNKLKTTGLTGLNAKLKASGQSPVEVPK